jgi:diguanylate cyclase (GGDEF)-like protein
MESGQKHSVLAVDDERSNLAVLNRILSPDYAVFTAKSGEEALDRARRDHPDLILLDIVMPGMDGFTVMEKLRSSQETKDIPVIFITGLNSEEDEERGFALGAVDYIMKPFRNAIVKARVMTHIQIVQQIKTIEMLGLMDPLTNIPNRRSFDRHMDIEWRRCIRERKPLSFLMMDLDKFKNYNDTYGHPQGDVLLKEVCKIFTSVARRPCDLAARVGGEEFAVILPDADSESALAIAEKIRKKVEALRISTADGSAVTYATISIGVITAIPQKDDSMKDFIAKADEYLYVAKNAGRNRVYAGK